MSNFRDETKECLDREERIVHLEDVAVETRERLMRIQTRLDQTATKADMHELQATIIKWIIGTVSGRGIAAITVMTLVLNTAPKAVPSPASPPVIITVPQPAAVAALK